MSETAARSRTLPTGKRRFELITAETEIASWLDVAIGARGNALVWTRDQSFELASRIAPSPKGGHVYIPAPEGHSADKILDEVLFSGSKTCLFRVTAGSTQVFFAADFAHLEGQGACFAWPKKLYLYHVRKHARHQLRPDEILAELLDPISGNTSEHTILDISAGGLAFITRSRGKPVVPGSCPGAFRFKLGGEEVLAYGIVRHTRPLSVDSIKVGVEFQDLGPAEVTRIKQFVEATGGG